MIHAVEFGSGDRVLVALHGWGGDHRTFKPLEGHLAEGWRIVALDLPGYGQSKPIEPFSLDSVVAAIVSVIMQYPAPVELIGSCSGAALGMEAALRIPERIRRIVALDLFAYMPLYFRFFTLPILGPIGYRLTFHSAVGRAALNALLWFRRTRQSNLMESFADKNPEVTLSYLGALATLEGPQRYASLPMPVEFVYGARTFRAVRRSVERWKATLPRLRVHRIEGAGHLVLDEAPQSVAAIIRDVR